MKVSERAGISFYSRFSCGRNRKRREQERTERDTERLREAEKQRDLLVNMNPSRFLSFLDIVISRGVKEKKKKHLKEEYRKNMYMDRPRYCHRGHTVKKACLSN